MTAFTAEREIELATATCNALTLNGMGVSPISFVAKPELTAAGVLITANIHKLFCIDITNIEPTDGGGSGRYPGPVVNRLEPGEVQNFYKPVDPEWQYAQEPSLYRKKHIKVRVYFNEKWNTKEFLVSMKHDKQIANVINLLNTTRERMNAVVRNIKRYATKAVMRVRNLRIRP